MYYLINIDLSGRSSGWPARKFRKCILPLPLVKAALDESISPMLNMQIDAK